MDDGDTVFVWERRYDIDAGLFQLDGLYQSIDNDPSNDKQICWKYAILSNNTIEDGGEEIDKIDTICTEVKSICDDLDGSGDINEPIIEDRMCAMNKIDLVIILDITLSDNVWIQLRDWIENMIIDIHNKLMDQEEQYSTMYNTHADILFRVSFITFGNELYDILQFLDVYDWGNQRVLLNNLLYDINEINIEHPNITTTRELSLDIIYYLNLIRYDLLII